MDFLLKAATLALSVIASVFTGVEAPVVQAKPVPTVSQAAFVPPPRESVEAKGSPCIVLVHVLRSPVADPESERIMAWIRSAQTGSKPIAHVPWYTRTDELSLPSLDETKEVIEALFSGEGDL